MSGVFFSTEGFALPAKVIHAQYNILQALNKNLFAVKAFLNLVL